MSVLVVLCTRIYKCLSSTVNVSCRNHSCSDVCRPAPPGLVKQLYICLCNESRDLSRDNRTCQRKKCSEQIRKSHQVKPLSSGDFVFSTHIINKSFHVAVFPKEDTVIGHSVYFSFCLQQQIFVNHGEFANRRVRSCLKVINVDATRGFTWSQMDLPADHSVSVVSAEQIVIFHTCQYWYFNCILFKFNFT